MFYDRTTLDNGMTLLSETMENVRSVAIGIWFAVGSRDESPAEAGMSHFMEHMMFKGTPTRTAAQISEEFDRLGAELNAFTSKEYTCYYARVVDQHVTTAVDILSDMITNSLLAQDAIDSEREVVIEEIARMEDTPDDRVHEMFAGALWPSHPIGLPVLGSRKTVGSFGHDDAVGFRERHYLTGNCIAVAAGHVDHDEFVKAVREKLRLREAPRSARERTEAVTEKRVVNLTKETEQAHVCYGVAGLNAHAPERFALSVMDTIFGGGMSSRLFQEIREKRGLAYAVYSYHSLYQDTGQYTIYAGTRPSNMEQVVGLIQGEVDRLLSDGVTDDELHRAKESLKGHLVLGLENTRNRMTRIGKAETIQGEILSIDELVARVDAVGRKEVADVAECLFSDGRVLSVIGPFDEADVSKLIS